MKYSAEEIAEVINMLTHEDLDIRSVTLSINTLFAVSDVPERTLEKLSLLRPVLSRFSEVVNSVQDKLGVNIVTRRVAVSPVQYFLEPYPDVKYAVKLGGFLDSLATDTGIDYIGGFSAYADRGIGRGTQVMLEGLAETMNSTSRLSGMLNAASTQEGLNVDAVKLFTAQLLKMSPHASSRVAIMANSPQDSPFVPSAHHGRGMPNSSINIAVSGPGVVAGAIRRARPTTFQELYEVIKKASFKVTRLGELVGRMVSEELGVPMGSVDLSLAPSPKVGDSVAEIIEAMGISRVGGHGSLTALAILMDAVKKGGSMATNLVGGLSSAFIPVSEDSIMAMRMREGYLELNDLLAMSAVCNSGIDMVGVPRDEGPEKITALILDVLSLGLMLNKIVGVRVIPVEGKPGEEMDLGGLLGKVVVAKMKDVDSSQFTSRNGFIPTPVKRLELG
ncbi:hypothetical protein L3N51_02126 [Metallosphaera sp. J1]|uniref:PFL family protein n=1 Tax=Metallosphaera javensis (ex Hofmann et al. 2022) TaxID=99938 RepID=UPI001EDF29FF|nr:PFL family protein [Metallosphaera javensis (ex Hofmann et al. 2022)]MCG3109830.1 hypothetical protein [Metallosphaera javensis (ex Hofmann et al. 2022)]